MICIHLIFILEPALILFKKLDAVYSQFCQPEVCVPAPAGRSFYSSQKQELLLNQLRFLPHPISCLKFFQSKKFCYFYASYFTKKQGTGWDLTYLPALGNETKCQATLISFSITLYSPTFVSSLNLRNIHRTVQISC